MIPIEHRTTISVVTRDDFEDLLRKHCDKGVQTQNQENQPTDLATHGAFALIFPSFFIIQPSFLVSELIFSDNYLHRLTYCRCKEVGMN